MCSDTMTFKKYNTDTLCTLQLVIILLQQCVAYQTVCDEEMMLSMLLNFTPEMLLMLQLASPTAVFINKLWR